MVSCNLHIFFFINKANAVILNILLLLFLNFNYRFSTFCYFIFALILSKTSSKNVSQSSLVPDEVD